MARAERGREKRTDALRRSGSRRALRIVRIRARGATIALGVMLVAPWLATRAGAQGPPSPGTPSGPSSGPSSGPPVAVASEGARRDGEDDPRRWSFAVGVGAGRADLRADQRSEGSRRVFALDLRVARRVGERARLGVQVAGWGFEASDLGDPARGEGLSTLGPFVEIAPLARVPLSLDATYGLASYWNNAPDGWDSRGSGWAAGAAYGLVRRASLTVVVGGRLGGGSLAAVRNAAVTLTGRRYRAADAQLRVSVPLGRRRPR